MRTPPIAAVVVALLATACSGSGASDNASETSSKTSPTTSSPAKEFPPGDGIDSSSESSDVEGEARSTKKLPAACDIDDADIGLFSRDWARVAGAVGRPDLREYTADLVKKTEHLASRAETCPGAKKAATLVLLARRLDSDAAEDTFDMDTINEFQSVGDGWLAALGYGDNALPTG